MVAYWLHMIHKFPSHVHRPWDISPAPRKALMSAARLVKEELLTFVKQQSEVQDTTGSDILAAP
jgi:hypothetical protein